MRERGGEGNGEEGEVGCDQTVLEQQCKVIVVVTALEEQRLVSLGRDRGEGKERGWKEEEQDVVEWGRGGEEWGGVLNEAWGGERCVGWGRSSSSKSLSDATYLEEQGVREGGGGVG